MGICLELVLATLAAVWLEREDVAPVQIWQGHPDNVWSIPTLRAGDSFRLRIEVANLDVTYNDITLECSLDGTLWSDTQTYSGFSRKTITVPPMNEPEFTMPPHDVIMHFKLDDPHPSSPDEWENIIPVELPVSEARVDAITLYLPSRPGAPYIDIYDYDAGGWISPPLTLNPDELITLIIYVANLDSVEHTFSVDATCWWWTATLTPTIPAGESVGFWYVPELNAAVPRTDQLPISIDVLRDGERQDFIENFIPIETGGNLVPIADFSWLVTAVVADVEPPLDPWYTVQFTDASVDPDGAVTGWTWTFGSINQNPTHNFSPIQPFTVRLIVVDNNGFIDYIDKIVEPYPDGNGVNGNGVNGNGVNGNDDGNGVIQPRIVFQRPVVQRIYEIAEARGLEKLIEILTTLFTWGYE